MKKQNVLARSSIMKSIVSNDMSFSSSSFTFNSSATSTQGIQLVPGVTCRGECFTRGRRFDIVTVEKNTEYMLELNKHGIISYYKSNVISSVGSLNSVFENIKTLNLKGFYYDKPINITYDNDVEESYYQYIFNSKIDEENFINLIETQGKHVQRQYDNSNKLIQEGLFPEGILYKETSIYNQLVTYSIRADYFALQLCSASTSYAGPVIC